WLRTLLGTRIDVRFRLDFEASSAPAERSTAIVTPSNRLDFREETCAHIVLWVSQLQVLPRTEPIHRNSYTVDPSRDFRRNRSRPSVRPVSAVYNPRYAKIV